MSSDWGLFYVVRKWMSNLIDAGVDDVYSLAL